MNVTLTLSDMLTAGAIVVPLGSAALYWAVRMAIRDAVRSLELNVATNYVTTHACAAIRAECERHRQDVERAKHAML